MSLFWGVLAGQELVLTEGVALSSDYIDRGQGI